MMEEEEIELWYEEQKQLLSESYIASIDKGMSLEQRERKFNRAMDKLARKYNAKYAKLRRQNGRSKKRNAFFKSLLFPLAAVAKGIAWLFVLIGSSVRNLFRAKCGQLSFRAGLVWTRNSYKIGDGLASAFRPFFFFYVKHLQKPCHTAAKPFTAFGRLVKRAVLGIGSMFSKAAAGVWKGLKTSCKYIAKHSVAGYKAVDSRLESVSKKYHEWYARRLQQNLEHKQAKKEARENRIKEKEELRKSKAGAAEPAAKGAQPEAEKQAGETIDKDLDENEDNV